MNENILPEDYASKGLAYQLFVVLRLFRLERPPFFLGFFGFFSLSEEKCLSIVLLAWNEDDAELSTMQC